MNAESMEQTGQNMALSFIWNLHGTWYSSFINLSPPIPVYSSLNHSGKNLLTFTTATSTWFVSVSVDVSCSPRRTEELEMGRQNWISNRAIIQYWPNKSYRSLRMQWAAVNTWRLVINEPPHLNETSPRAFLYPIKAIHGQPCRAAGTPPTTRLCSTLLYPHPVAGVGSVVRALFFGWVGPSVDGAGGAGGVTVGGGIGGAGV